jgi:two-component system, NarL family, response regulator
MVVIAEAADGEAAVALYLLHKPDVALIDLRMPGLDGWEVIRRIKAADPNANPIVLTAHDGDEDIELSLKAGARGYLLKDVAAEELTKCIRDVKEGKTRLAPGIAAKLAEKVTQVQLTVRELAVLQVLAFGKTNKEIAERLDISDGTVRVHLTNLFRKLNVSTRTEAMATAVRRGLVRL